MKISFILKSIVPFFVAFSMNIFASDATQTSTQAGNETILEHMFLSASSDFTSLITGRDAANNANHTHGLTMAAQNVITGKLSANDKDGFVVTITALKGALDNGVDGLPNIDYTLDCTDIVVAASGAGQISSDQTTSSLIEGEDFDANQTRNLYSVAANAIDVALVDQSWSCELTPDASTFTVSVAMESDYSETFTITLTQTDAS